MGEDMGYSQNCGNLVLPLLGHRKRKENKNSNNPQPSPTLLQPYTVLMVTLIVTETFSPRPRVPRNVTLCMIVSSIFGVIFVISAVSSLHMYTIGLFWLNGSYSAGAQVRSRLVRTIICAAIEIIVAALSSLFAFVNTNDTISFFLWLFVTSFFSFIFSIANICWSVYNLRKWRELEDFEGTASKEGDYRSLRAEQLGLLACSDTTNNNND